MEFSVDQIAQMLGGEILGDGDRKVSQVAKIEEANDLSISFLSNLKYESFLYTTKAAAVIVNKTFEPKKEFTTTLIKVEDSYTAFTALLTEYQKFIKSQKTGVEQPSYLGTSSKVGSDVYRAAFSYIGENVSIGDNVKLYPHSYIGDNVTIGDNTVIEAGAKIYSDCVIGQNCVIKAGAVIGSDGFGFAPQEDGTYVPIPQLGNVIIKDHVSIGSNTVVDRATMGSTVIESGVKLDNLIQIAHNVEVGKNTVVAAQTGVSGSSKIGDNCMIGGQVGLAGHMKLANKTVVLAQSGLSRTITKEGEMMMGSPAFERGKYLKAAAVFRRLPEMINRIKDIEDKILDLSNDK